MRVAVLVSGGVDSSVALARLARSKERDLVAFYLKIWLEDELAFLGECPWEEDLVYVRAVCDDLGVPLEVLSLQQDYHALVVRPALEELRAGRTPSPDLACNALVKFGAFVDRVGESFDRVASGHYARVERASGRPRLLRAPDPIKDQTYFLSRLSEAQLARAMFPIGHLTKAEVRAEAEALGLATRARPDSQGICFLGKLRFPDFVAATLGEAPGDIVDADTGALLGHHRGLWYHTIGQRRGLGLGGGPWFVVGKDLAAGRLLVAHQTRYRPHQRGRFIARDLHWIGAAPAMGAPLLARLRHGPALSACRLAPGPERSLEVTLDAPDQGVAPGQYAVFYDGEVCLGSGVIA